jgi:hypothetical protein
MTGGSLSGNGASLIGGGIYTTLTAASFFDVSIMFNGAPSGGGFYLESGSLTLTQSRIVMNFAGFGNGGVRRTGATFVDGGGNLIIDTIEVIP